LKTSAGGLNTVIWGEGSTLKLFKKNRHMIFERSLLQSLELGVLAHLFDKVPRPGDSEGGHFNPRVKSPSVITSLITQR